MKRLLRQALRDWPATMISAILLAGGLLALGFPVMLGDYDRYGAQINCGNGYVSELTQAAAEDQHLQSPGASPADIHPPTNYVDKCNAAVTHRRALAILISGLGALMVIPGMVKWWCSRPTESDSEEAWSEIAHPDEAMHQAALLDRQAHAPWQKPPTL